MGTDASSIVARSDQVEATDEAAIDCDSTDPSGEQLADLTFASPHSASVSSSSEAERRQMRLELGKQRVSKWNFGGYSNKQIDDRIREHEVELESRRANAFTGRGRSMEDEGDEASARYVRQERRNRDL